MFLIKQLLHKANIVLLKTNQARSVLSTLGLNIFRHKNFMFNFSLNL